MGDGAQSDPFFAARLSMVENQLRGRGIRNERLLEAMLRVPRHQFAPRDYESEAYGDYPIPIAEGQTISQPYVVAAMIEALEIGPQDKVLEVGTGSGYQTAILAELAGTVHSIERHPSLVEYARTVLTRLGYENVSVHEGDGSQGLPDHAPFDAIIVAAAAPSLPRALFEQLNEGGRMIVPVGGAYGQELELARKHQGQMLLSRLEGVRFVPLIGREGFQSGW